MTSLAGTCSLVEDIVDSGLTLAFLLRNLAARQPASLAVCALLVKDIEVSVPELAYVGFRIPRDFVVGYGLDVAERYRNLTCVRRYNGAAVPPLTRRASWTGPFLALGLLTGWSYRAEPIS